MVVEQAHRLSRHHLLLLEVVAVPLLLLILALAAHQFTAQREALLEGLAQTTREQRQTLDHIVKAARDHVRGLQQMAQDRLEGRVPQGLSPLRPALRLNRHANGIEGVTLDEVAGKPLATRVGNLLGDRDDTLTVRLVTADQARGLWGFRATR